MMRVARPVASIAIGLSLVLAACTPTGTTPGSSPAGTATTKPAETPRKGGTFVGVLGADPVAGNRNTATDLNTFYAWSGVFSALVYVDATRTPRPDLAESWTISPDEKTYTFKLRQNAKFHDGKPVTSADVKYTLEEVTSKYNSQARPILLNVASITTPDSSTVVFALTEPSAVFLLAMAHQFMVVLPKHLFEGSDPRTNPVNSKPIGSGPFKFEEWVKGDHITLVRNPDYFLSGQPYLDKVVFRIIPDAGSRTIAFQKGEVDFLPGQFLAREQATELKNSVPGVYVDDTKGPPGQELMFFNTTKKPLDDVKVRRALVQAIDQKAIVDKAFFGVGAAVSTSHFEKNLGVFHNPNVKFPAFDVAAANKALDDAGYAKGADGTRFALTIAYMPGNDSDRRSAELVRDMLSAAGIKITAQVYDAATIGRVVFTEGSFDLFTGSFTSNNDPQLGSATKYISATIGVVNANGSRYKNPEIDKLYAEGAATTNIDKRKAAYWKAQEILAVDMPTLPLIDYMNVDFYRPEIRGYDTTPLGFPYMRIVNAWRTQ
jgi:peptide/nickel transport system substrate-binding protein